MTHSKVYTWHKINDHCYTEMIWIAPFQGYGTYDPDPIAAAEKAHPLLMAKENGHRVLFFSHGSKLKLDDPAKLVALGLDHEDQAYWYRAFFWRLHQLGTDIDLIVMDEEVGFSKWSLPEGSFQKIYQDPSAFRRLPNHLQAYKPEEYTWPWNRQAIIDWGMFSSEKVQEALYSNVAQTANRAFGKSIRFTNYNWMRLSPEIPVTDLNGWPLYTESPTSISAPSLYPTGQGNAVKNAENPKDADLERCLTIARSCKARGGTLMPWVPFPDFVGRDIFTRLVKGLREIGVEEFLYWNPYPQELDQQDVARKAFFE